MLRNRLRHHRTRDSNRRVPYQASASQRTQLHRDLSSHSRIQVRSPLASLLCRTRVVRSAVHQQCSANSKSQSRRACLSPQLQLKRQKQTICRQAHRRLCSGSSSLPMELPKCSKAATGGSSSSNNPTSACLSRSKLHSSSQTAFASTKTLRVTRRNCFAPSQPQTSPRGHPSASTSTWGARSNTLRSRSR